ncbi:MuDR family transposase [Cucumis melo var. makuwa]|uniref:MuDR family transposase n=1 Tax=Cucumis melo var. makuwa TaxID=1194695 RepID=A0A5D3DCI1_CUCMM|nr:MuDR family transposase [Cucumis melo var. makuwa]
MSLILREVRFDASPSSIQLSILLDYDITDIQTVVQIYEDKDISWFLSLVKGQITRHPLVAHAIAHVSNMDLEWSSSVVDNGMDNLCSLLPSSSIDDDFQILTNIHVSRLSSTFDLKEKGMFASKELLSKSFYYIVIKNNFEFKNVRSNSKSIEFKCSQDNCPWYVRASCYKGGELWRLRKYIANHNCFINVIQTTHGQASSSLKSDCIVKDFSSFDRSTLNDIMIHMRTKLGVNVSYYKAWRAKELVMNSLDGEVKESYALIPNFFTKLKEINPEGHFKYCFMAIGARIEGWKYCRPNISVDVNAINDVQFQVVDGRKKFIVQLDCKSCTCRIWDLDEIPCAYALAVLLRPVGNHANWKSIGIDMNILPPTFKRRAGRPRK